jgi:hypothetical protein
MGNMYAMRPCGYCGRITGKNEGEHVIPRCLYTSHTPSIIQRLKIPACPTCNRGFSVSEAHFRNIISACGFTPSPARLELIKKSIDSFHKPISGKGDFLKFVNQIVETGETFEDGKPVQRIYPHKDAEMRFITRKAVRGLVHSLDWKTIIPDDHVTVTQHFPTPPAFEELFTDYYIVPNSFSSRYKIIDQSSGPEAFDEMHSVWQIRFHDMSLSCVVTKHPVPV